MKSNQISESQSIILQNTNEKEPIQLKVNPVTDYWALWFTILASVIVSAIAAYVTIKLITDSNAKLIENQNLQNKNLLDNQSELQNKLIESQNQQLQREVKSKNRQEWINKVRELVAETLTENNSFFITVAKEHNLCVQRHRKLTTTPRDKQLITLEAPYPETVQIMRSFDKNITLLDLLLSKDDDLDRKIYNHLNNISKLQGKLFEIYSLSLKNTTNQDDIIFKQLEILEISKKVTLLTKELLKNEWNRVKNLE